MPVEIFNEMKNVLRDARPSFTTVKEWAMEFKCGCASLEDGPHTGHPKRATTQEIIWMHSDSPLPKSVK